MWLGRTKSLAPETWLAERDQTRRLWPGRSGLALRVLGGRLLVTQAGDPEDHLVGPGGRLVLEGRGLAVAWALEASEVLISRPPGEGRGAR